MRAITEEERELINGGLIRPDTVRRIIHIINDIINDRDHETDCKDGGI